MARKSKKGVSVNLNDVESYFRPPVGTYSLEIAGVEQGEGNSLAWDFKITAGKYKGKEFRDYTNLEPQSLWRLRGLVEATGADIEDAELDLEYFEGLVGEKLSASVGYREYEGKEKLNVTYLLAGEDDEDDKPAKKSSRRDKDEDEDDKPAKRRSKRDADDGEDEEEKPRNKKRPSKDDDEEDDKPAKKGKSKKKAELTQEEIRDMDTDELEKLVEEHDLDVDLSDFKTLKKQQNAVIDAAGEAGLMAEE